MRIGIVAQNQADDTFGVQKNYLEFIYQLGYPIVLLPSSWKDFEEYYGKLDALVLPGGMDVNPDRYSKAPSFFTGASNPYLEFFDSNILPKLIGKLPIFGICRGLQTLNVIRGGTLVQHLFTHPVSENATHKVHKVHSPDNKFKMDVNSFHHQAIGKLGDGFKVELKSNDGFIEAISDIENKIFAVQWHPERLKDEYSLSKFEQLIKE